jgi:hypothetical protein
LTPIDTNCPIFSIYPPHPHLKPPATHPGGTDPKWAAHEAYAASSAINAPIAAANGSILTTPEKFARSPIEFSIKNVGR